MVDAFRIVNEDRITPPGQALQQLHNLQPGQYLFRVGKALIACPLVSESPCRYKLACLLYHIIKLEFYIRRAKRLKQQLISHRCIIEDCCNASSHIVDLSFQQSALCIEVLPRGDIFLAQLCPDSRFFRPFLFQSGQTFLFRGGQVPAGKQNVDRLPACADFSNSAVCSACTCAACCAAFSSSA